MAENRRISLILGRSTSEIFEFFRRYIVKAKDVVGSTLHVGGQQGGQHGEKQKPWWNWIYLLEAWYPYAIWRRSGTSYSDLGKATFEMSSQQCKTLQNLILGAQQAASYNEGHVDSRSWSRSQVSKKTSSPAFRKNEHVARLFGSEMSLQQNTNNRNAGTCGIQLVRSEGVDTSELLLLLLQSAAGQPWHGSDISASTLPSRYLTVRYIYIIYIYIEITIFEHGISLNYCRAMVSSSQPVANTPKTGGFLATNTGFQPRNTRMKATEICWGGDIFLCLPDHCPPSTGCWWSTCVNCCTHSVCIYNYIYIIYT